MQAAGHTSGRDRPRRRASVEELQTRIVVLVGRRQALREDDSDPAALERNRRQLVRCYRELGRALIERHLSERRAA